MEDIEKEWCVYMHTNTIDSKRYIGITSRDVEDRWRNGGGYAHNSYFSNAIAKYGWDAFAHEVLFTGLDAQSAKEKEIELIAEYNTTDKSRGYNLTIGGDGVHGYVHPEETRKRISAMLIGNQYAKGMHHSDETKMKISESLKGNTRARGTHRTDEVRQQMAQSHTGKKLSEETRIKISESNRRRVFTEETRKRISASRVGKPTRSLPVDRVDENGVVLESFPSAKDAGNKYGIRNTQILDVCHGRAKSSHGMFWKFHNKYN